MSAPQPNKRKKHFTVSQANAMLPLLRAILRDVCELATDLHQRGERLMRVQKEMDTLSHSAREEFEQQVDAFERDRDQLNEHVQELLKLSVELKDPFVGLVDFPCIMDEHEVYLCWRMDEPDVAHWHELDTGFAGRQKLTVDSVR